MESEDFCLVLSRAFARLLSLMDATATEVKVCLGTVVLIVCEFIKYNQTKIVVEIYGRKAMIRAL